MKEMIQQLEKIGFDPEVREQIARRVDGDEEGLCGYVRFCVALFGHKHERVGGV